ncbi:endo-1,4-beta-xylanase [Georgenia sp. H159]|uniref:endo-1,4-beta-xylanase n=1 Tax=Georgenia sp. H159 TaxID=3076115 RepID=UPI002D79BFB8|nr:endo-1,4-beta-xylanase [Georgenia sp. H159]
MPARVANPATRPQPHRTAEAELTVVGADGRPLVDTEVTVEQTRHRFAFGNIGFDLIPLANGETTARPDSPFGGASPDQGEHLAALWLDLFNTATLPFYWAGFEPERGRPDTERLLRTAQWFQDRGCTVKGHPLAWHTLAPDWLRGLPTPEVAEVLRARIRREVSDFAGVVDTWDAINEVVIMHVFANEEHENAITRLCREQGRVPTVRLAVEEARAANPSATLLLNDFDLSADYERLIEDVLAAGVRIDALGLQTHMHQGYWGEENTLAMLDRFARFGLPLHLTETTLLSGDLMPPEIVDLNDYQVPSWPSTPEGEERQADEVVRHYRTLVSHPAVEAITYWGITDDGAWLGAPAGLVRADGTSKPAYEALRQLVKEEWWLPATTARTDGQGRVQVRGFLGDYRVTAAAGAGAVGLDRPGEVTAEVALEQP